MLPLQGAWVPFLVGKLRSCKLCCKGKKKKTVENSHGLRSLTSWSLLLKINTLIMIGPLIVLGSVKEKKGDILERIVLVFF